MFNIGLMELIVLMLIAFIVIGPRDLPKVARFLGRTYRYVKGLTREIVATLDLDEEIESLKETTDSVKETKKKVEAVMDPKSIFTSMEDELNKVQEEVKSALKDSEDLFSSVQEELHEESLSAKDSVNGNT